VALGTRGRRSPGSERFAAVAGPVSGAVLAAFLASGSGTPLESGAVVLVVLLLASLLAGRRSGWGRLLPLMGVVSRIAPPFGALVILLVGRSTVKLPDLGPLDTVGVCALSVVISVLAERIGRRVLGSPGPTRVALIGSAHSADALAREIRVSSSAGYVIAGRIAPANEPPDAESGEVPTLGRLGELGGAVAEHDIRLLLMTGEVPRLDVFDEVAHSCMHLPVRLRELSGFYEETFGHVPVGEINASWFGYLMHPAYEAGAPWTKRAVDIVVAGVVLLLTAPLMGLLALLIRRDGGSVLFRQVRIGEGGRSFEILKLRTMHENAPSMWAAADDPRVTRVGRVLRRTHLDELPQLVNVLRGEMSVVGPRPEQPGFVDRLEHVVPFYQRRHLVKPGLTGWAQVRCGYAGSDIGSAWKVCHDLYYLKHRSLALDLVILGETLRTLVADPQYTAEPASVAFILAPTDTELDASPPAGALAALPAP
jgi:exopolysaccharide biosynthesis polyprenyl glycosylphosphotransferase